MNPPATAPAVEAFAPLAPWAMPGLSRHALEQAQRVDTPAGSLAWQRAGRAALALGDPLIPAHTADESFEAVAAGRVLEAFINRARSLGLQPVLAPISEAFRELCEASGLQSQVLGREGQVDLAGFDLRGNARKNLRQSYERGLREGLRFALWEPPLTSGQLAAVREVSQAWLHGRPLGELKIGLGWFDPGRLRAHPLAVSCDARGRVAAFATWHGEEGPVVGLDLLRRHPQAPPGAVEVLLVDLLRRLRGAGHRRASLGLAPLTDPGAAGRVVRWVGKQFLRYDCRGLERFKGKFNPRWSDRYVAYASRKGLVDLLAAGARGA